MSSDNLKKTPLNAAHRELGGKMVDFGGWDMPVQYSGIIEEHNAVRNLAAAATRYLEPLKATLAKTPDERDKGLILSSIESCEAIIDSVKQLPPEVKETKKKGKS